MRCIVVIIDLEFIYHIIVIPRYHALEIDFSGSIDVAQILGAPRMSKFRILTIFKNCEHPF